MNTILRELENTKHALETRSQSIKGVVNELLAKKAGLSSARVGYSADYTSLVRERAECELKRGGTSKRELCAQKASEARKYTFAFVALGALLGGIFAYLTILIPGIDPATATAIVLVGFVVFFALAETAFSGLMSTIFRIEPMSSDVVERTRRIILVLGSCFIFLFAMMMIVRFAIGSEMLFLIFQVATEVTCLSLAGIFSALRKYWQFPLTVEAKLIEARTQLVNNHSEISRIDEHLRAQEFLGETCEEEIKELDQRIALEEAQAMAVSGVKSNFKGALRSGNSGSAIELTRQQVAMSPVDKNGDASEEHSVNEDSRSASVM